MKYMTDKEYQKMEGLRQSELALLIDTPKKFVHRERLKKETENMKLGSLFHCLLLTPDMFNSQYYFEPDTIGGEEVNKRKPAHREYLLAFQMEREELGATMIEKEVYDTACGMRDALMNIEEAKRDIYKAGKEIGGSARLEGLLVKGKCDLLTDSCVIDVKTTGDASPDAFSKSVHTYHYDFQLEVYGRIFDRDASLIYAVENKFPYCVGLYEMSEWKELGRKKLEKALANYRRLEQANFSGASLEYTEGLIKTLSPPAWAISRAGLGGI
jgi:hypothetical protein